MISVSNVIAAVGSQQLLRTEDANGTKIVSDLLEFVLQKGVVCKNGDVRNSILLAVSHRVL